MYIANPTAIAAAIDVTCKTGDLSTDPVLTGLLGGIAQRLAGLCDMDTFEYVETIDFFRVPEAPRRQFARESYMRMVSNPASTTRLLLTNGFVDPDSPIGVYAPDGSDVTPLFAPTSAGLNLRMGWVDIAGPWLCGELYAVQYKSGFKPYVDPDNPDDPPTFLDTSREPWIAAAIEQILSLRYRTGPRTPKFEKGTNVAQLDAASRRELQAIVFESYQRPRYGVVMPTNTRLLGPG